MNKRVTTPFADGANIFFLVRISMKWKLKLMRSSTKITKRLAFWNKCDWHGYKTRTVGHFAVYLSLHILERLTVESCGNIWHNSKPTWSTGWADSNFIWGWALCLTHLFHLGEMGFVGFMVEIFYIYQNYSPIGWHVIKDYVLISSVVLFGQVFGTLLSRLE